MGRDRVDVWCVDDDPDYRALLCERLRRDRPAFEPTGFGDPVAVLDRLDDGDRPDCVVTDYDMPGVDGLTLLRRAREAAGRLPVVMLTGRGSETVASEATAAGVDGYVRKGSAASFERTAAAVERAVGRRRTEREHRRRSEALAAAREGICLFDADGEVTYANPAYAALYGYDDADLRGRSWRAFHPDDEAERIEAEVLPTVEATGEWTGESAGLRADDDRFPEWKTVGSLPDGGYVVVVVDLGDR
jgi:PAS domain S-box-containing protein